MDGHRPPAPTVIYKVETPTCSKGKSAPRSVKQKSAAGTLGNGCMLLVLIALRCNVIADAVVEKRMCQCGVAAQPSLSGTRRVYPDTRVAEKLDRSLLAPYEKVQLLRYAK